MEKICFHFRAMSQIGQSHMIWEEKKLPYGKQEFMGNYFRFIFEQNLTQNSV